MTRSVTEGKKMEDAMKIWSKQALIAGSSFAGGLITGVLLSASAGKSATRISSRLMQNGRKVLQEMKRSLFSPVPDLYLATEQFQLDEVDLMDA